MGVSIMTILSHFSPFALFERAMSAIGYHFIYCLLAYWIFNENFTPIKERLDKLCAHCGIEFRFNRSTFKDASTWTGEDLVLPKKKKDKLSKSLDFQIDVSASNSSDEDKINSQKIEGKKGNPKKINIKVEPLEIEDAARDTLEAENVKDITEVFKLVQRNTPKKKGGRKASGNSGASTSSPARRKRINNL